jgi:ribonuclease I
MKFYYLLIIIIIIIGFCVWSSLNTKKEYIFTFIYDEKLNRYMIHGLWLNNTIYCDNYKYILPHDSNNFIKKNWYDKYYRDGENTLFKYEYIKHGSCFDLSSTEYLRLVEKLYEKYYEKYVKNSRIKRKEIWLYLDENYNFIKMRYK